MPMKWIGLTGGIASGKSTVAKILRDLGHPVIDADDLARKAVRPGSVGLKQVVKAFGREVLLPNGELDRKKLGALIFQDSKARLELENILHPLIQQMKEEERRKLEASGCKLAFYDIPLLFEKNLAADFDETVLVYAPLQAQVSRLCARDNLIEAEAKKRLESQLPIEDKKKLATHIIDNTKSLKELEVEVSKLFRRR